MFHDGVQLWRTPRKLKVINPFSVRPRCSGRRDSSQKSLPTTDRCHLNGFGVVIGVSGSIPIHQISFVIGGGISSVGHSRTFIVAIDVGSTEFADGFGYSLQLLLHTDGCDGGNKFWLRY